MGKAHEANKAGKKPPLLTPKEKKAAKQARKHMSESPPFMGHHRAE